MRPGFHRNMAYDDYAKVDALRFSAAKHFARSAAHARSEMLKPPDQTPSQYIGTAVHTAILEPERFASTYVVPPKLDRRTKLGKAEWEAWTAAHPNALLLSDDDKQRIDGMVRSVNGHPFVQAIREGMTSVTELSVFWHELVDGHEVLCKSRPDWVATDGERNFVLDVKTTRDASRAEFSRTVANLKYHAQAASQLSSIQAIRGGQYEYIWIAVENTEPYGVALYRACDAMLLQGLEEWRSWVRKYYEARVSQVWSGYPDEIIDLDLPKWAQYEPVGDITEVAG